MVGELLGRDVRHEAGEVDHAAYVAVRQRVPNSLRADAVPVLERPLVEGVHEIADAFDIGERRADGISVRDVATDPVDVVAPGEAVRVRLR